MVSSEVLELILRTLAVGITALIVIVQAGAETRFNPIKRRGDDGLELLSRLERVDEPIPFLDDDEYYEIKKAACLLPGDPGFRLVTDAVKRNRSFNGRPGAYYLVDGKLPSYRGTIFHPEPSGAPALNPNSALLVVYSDKLEEVIDSEDPAAMLTDSQVVDVLEFRATDPYTTLELRTTRRWVKEEVRHRTHQVVTALVLIWATISIAVIL